MRSLPLSCARSWLLPQRSEGRVAGALRALALVHFGSLVVPPSLPQRLLGRAALSTMSSSEAGGDLKAEKQALRKELRGRLAALDDAAILRQSEAVSRQLFALPEYAQSTGVACFLSMPKEFNTRPILARLFEDGKRVYLPRVESVKEHTMSLLEASSLADVDSFPPGRWGIPEPSREGPARLEALEEGSQLDMVVVPGLAFDRIGGRLGQGAGFYDRYLAKIQELKGQGKVWLVGVTLDELMVERVPCDSLDFLMHHVLWPSKQMP